MYHRAEAWRGVHARQDVASTLDSSIPTSIAAPTATLAPTQIVSAASPTDRVTTDLSFSNGVRPITSVGTGTATLTSDTASSTSAKSTATSSATSTSKGSSNNLGILIPAIAAPVAAILLISFVAFWLFVRHRSKKLAKSEPEFVMEGMKEKPQERPVTADSNSSTRKLVPPRTKEAVVSAREIARSGPDAFGPNKEFDFAPPRMEAALDSRPGSRQDDPVGKSKAVPNFSRGPRSHTASRDDTASLAPLAPPTAGQQDRSGRRAGPHPSSAGAGASRPNNGARGPVQRGPGPRSGTKPHEPRNGSFSRPLGPSVGARGEPAPINVRANRPSQDGNLHQPPPGAYNGSSPISQYSPIVKDAPKFGTSPVAARPNPQSRPAGDSISSLNDQGMRKPPPSAIKTAASPMMSNDPKFSDENLQIARLANNSRFHSVVATTAATSPATEEPPTPSPRLPPPATRDAPPTNYNIPLPQHEPPAPASIQARLNGASISDRRSVVSGLSDDYVDMEVDDNKSDVSSLDEREKWQMQSDNDRANSRQAGLGSYGGLGARPPLLGTGLENHESEASGSQYSLGYYTKDGTSGELR